MIWYEQKYSKNKKSIFSPYKKKKKKKDAMM